MKALRFIALALMAFVLGATNANAQNAQTKAQLTKIRAAYTKAQTLAEKGIKGPRKNYQVYESWTSDPNGDSHSKTEFIFDNSKVSEQIEVYPCILVLARKTIGKTYEEYLYDEEGRMIFSFNRSDFGEGWLTERRYYYNNNAPIWMIEKRVDHKTKKVIKEEQMDISSEESDYYSDAIYMGRDAAELREAFISMNAIHD